jgi:hypothetical protein
MVQAVIQIQSDNLVVVHAIIPTRARDKLLVAIRDHLAHVEGHPNEIIKRIDEVRGIAQQHFPGRHHFKHVAR